VKRKPAAAAAAVLVVAAGLAAAVLTLRAASAAPTSAPPPVAYNGADGWHQGRARLPAIYIGESSVFVRTPHWSRWSGSSAQGLGTLWVNTCAPACSAGHYRIYRAQVSLWRVAVRDGVRYFTRMRLRYRHGRQRDYVFRWGILPGAAIPGWNGGPGGPA
jgi:hypothetical protein